MKEGEKAHTVPLLSFDIYYEQYHRLLERLENQKALQQAGRSGQNYKPPTSFAKKNTMS